jgi:hypothetical protein
VPGLEVRSSRGIVGRVGWHSGTDVPNTGQVKSKVKQMAGLKDSTSKNNCTCFVDYPTGVRIK